MASKKVTSIQYVWLFKHYCWQRHMYAKNKMAFTDVVWFDFLHSSHVGNVKFSVCDLSVIKWDKYSGLLPHFPTYNRIRWYNDHNEYRRVTSLQVGNRSVPPMTDFGCVKNTFSSTYLVLTIRIIVWALQGGATLEGMALRYDLQHSPFRWGTLLRPA